MAQPGGIHHFKGTGSGADKYYCARRLGTALIPGSDGQCGPNNGPQCAECRAYQAAQVSCAAVVVLYDRNACSDSGVHDGEALKSLVPMQAGGAAGGGDVSAAVVGSLVVLAPDFASYSDASGGPLSLGQVGVVVQTSGTRLQVKPQSGGDRVWWYVGHGGTVVVALSRWCAGRVLTECCCWCHACVGTTSQLCGWLVVPLLPRVDSRLGIEWY